MTALFEPGQQVSAPYPLTLQGYAILAGQHGKILSRYRDTDETWLYRVCFEPNAIVLVARDDEIALWKDTDEE